MISKALDNFRGPVARFGAGSTAMALLAIGLWPTVEVEFSPEKAFAFAVAFFAWAYIELFPEPGDNQSERGLAATLTMHDVDLAGAIAGTVDGDFVRFLKNHDFGSSWRKASLDPAYALQYLLTDTNSVFEQEELSRQLSKVRGANEALVEKTALYGGPVSGAGLEFFDMIPTVEKHSGLRSERTERRIQETNEAADQLAEELSDLFAEMRQAGISLAPKPVT